MISQDLIKYIDIQLKRGLSWDKIKEILLANGWTNDAIEENYREVLKTVESQPETVNVPHYEEPTQITEPVTTDLVVKEQAVEEQKPVVEQPVSVVEKPIEEKPTQSVINPMPAIATAIPAEPVFEEPKQIKSNKRLVIILSAIVGVLLLVGGAIAGIYYYQSVLPQKVFYDAISNSLKNIGSNAMEVSTSVTAEMGIKNGVTFISGFENYDYYTTTLNVQTSFDPSNKNILKLAVSGKLEASAKNSQQTVEAITSSADVELRTDNDNVYGVINDLQGIGNLFSDKNMASEYQQYFDKYIKGQWFTTPMLKDQNGESYYSIYRKAYDDQIQKNIANSKNFDKYLLNAIKVKLINSEKIENDDCYHYKATFDQKGLWVLIKENSADTTITTEQWASYENEYNNNIWPIISKISLELWATKKDSYIRKEILSGRADFESDESLPMSYISASNQTTFKKINSVTIDVPQNTKSLNEIMNVFDIVGGNYAIKTYLSQFASGINDYKTKNGTYIGFISKGIGKSIMQSIDAIGGNPLVAYTSKTKYCLAKELLGGEGMWCIDYNGFSSFSSNCKKETYSCK